MKKRILPVLAGLAVGFVMVMIGDTITHQLYPPPAGFDFTDKEAIRVFASTLPTMAFIIMLTGWALSAFFGGMTTGKLAKESWKRLSLVTGGILMLACIGNMLLIPQPLWMNIIGVALYFPLAYLGAALVQPARG